MNEVFPIDGDTLGTLRPLNKVVFSLGANIGDTLETLQSAVNRLAETPNLVVVAVSPVYLTKAVDMVDQPDFHNIIVLAESTLEPLTLLERAQAIELAYGRERGVPKGPRTLDIDLIQVGRRESHTDQLTLPHPRAHERAFVLRPWLDVDPGATLPQGPVNALLADLGTDGIQPIDARIDKP